MTVSAVGEKLRELEITGISLIVPDVVEAARSYAGLLSVAPWRFFDLPLCDVTPEEATRLDSQAVIRVGAAKIGRLNLQLVQPLERRESLSRFSQEQGRGIHHVSFGSVEGFDDLIEAMHDVHISDLQPTIGGDGPTFALFDTQDELCTRLEVVKPLEDQDGPSPWGTYGPDEEGAVDLSNREIVQLGIVVDDVESVAANYTKLLGVEGWSFVEFTPSDAWHGVFHDVPVEGARFHIKAALAWHGKMQIELLQPVSGTSTHMDFLRVYGPGIHHVSFGAIPDHDEVLAALQAQGLVVEMGGQLGRGGWFTYLQSQKPLATIFEMVRSAA